MGEGLAWGHEQCSMTGSPGGNCGCLGDGGGEASRPGSPWQRAWSHPVGDGELSFTG